jgi:hypothetical protein
MHFFTSQRCLHSRDVYFTMNLSDGQNWCNVTHRNYVCIVAMCISHRIWATDRMVAPRWDCVTFTVLLTLAVFLHYNYSRIRAAGMIEWYTVTNRKVYVIMHNNTWYKSCRRVRSFPHTRDLCPRMCVTLTCGTTISHKTRGRECVRDPWLEKFGDHSCTLLLLKHVRWTTYAIITCWLLPSSSLLLRHRWVTSSFCMLHARNVTITNIHNVSRVRVFTAYHMQNTYARECV